MDQKNKSVLVTGGCGYIGSHVCCQLSESGYKVIVVDDLSTGHEDALLHQEILVKGNCGDRKLMTELMEQYQIESVLHFAGSIIVPESIQLPLEYYHNNVANTLALLEAVKDQQIKHFILSSSAAVYGDDHLGPIDEQAPTRPIHPYGKSKLVDEWMLDDFAAVNPTTYAAIRYFNVAGADADLRIGQSSKVSTHLIKIACEVATGKREQMSVYGEDYNTPDGSCVRDYVHVVDLARAHLAALEYLEKGGASLAVNCGYNRGYSVKEVVAAIEQVHGSPLNKVIGERRPGDVAQLVAKAEKIQGVMNWTPQYADLKKIIESALAWEKKLAAKN